jgi:hypothetical protein
VESEAMLGGASILEQYPCIPIVGCTKFGVGTLLEVGPSKLKPLTSGTLARGRGKAWKKSLTLVHSLIQSKYRPRPLRRCSSGFRSRPWDLACDQVQTVCRDASSSSTCIY